MMHKNEMELVFDSRSINEGFARVSVAAFLTQLNPTLEEVSDVKTAVSEAVTNAIIHGYEKEVKKIWIRCRIEESKFYIEIEDTGVGIADRKSDGTAFYNETRMRTYWNGLFRNGSIHG